MAALLSTACRRRDAPDLFSRVFTLFTAVSLFVFLAVSFYAAEIVAFPIPFVNRTLIPSNYWMALDIVPVALLAYVFQGWYYNFSAGVYIKKRTRYLIHCTLIAGGVSLALNFLLVPRYGLLGAVWAICLAFAVMALALYVITRRFYEVPYHRKRVAGMMTLTALAFACWLLIPGAQVWWAELLLLIAYVAGVFLLGVVRIADLRTVVRKRSDRT